MTRKTLFYILPGAAVLASFLAVAGHNTPEALEARVSPVGMLNVSGAATAAVTAESGPADGESVYNTACVACHGAGIAGAPALGDVSAWAARVGRGIDGLALRAIQGFTGETGVMPAKGGNPGLSDEAVTAAVRYMVEQSR